MAIKTRIRAQRVGPRVGRDKEAGTTQIRDWQCEDAEGQHLRMENWTEVGGDTEDRT